MCQNGVLFVSVDLRLSLLRQQHPKCQPAIRLLYPSFFCKLRTSSKPTNQNLHYEHSNSCKSVNIHNYTYVHTSFFSQCPLLSSPETLNFPSVSPCISCMPLMCSVFILNFSAASLMYKYLVLCRSKNVGNVLKQNRPVRPYEISLS